MSDINTVRNFIADEVQGRIEAGGDETDYAKEAQDAQEALEAVIAQLAAKDAELAQAREDRDSHQRGALAALSERDGLKEALQGVKFIEAGSGWVKIHGIEDAQALRNILLALEGAP